MGKASIVKMGVLFYMSYTEWQCCAIDETTQAVKSRNSDFFKKVPRCHDMTIRRGINLLIG